MTPNQEHSDDPLVIQLIRGRQAAGDKVYWVVGGPNWPLVGRFFRNAKPLAPRCGWDVQRIGNETHQDMPHQDVFIFLTDAQIERSTLEKHSTEKHVWLWDPNARP